MSLSLSQRVFRIVFWTNLLSLVFIILIAWLALEDLEKVSLDQDQQIELGYFLETLDPAKPKDILSGTIIFAYRPEAAADFDSIPLVFTGVTVPFRGEVEVLENDYEVFTGFHEQGRYYFAKDLAVFEERESFYTSLLLSLTGCVVVLSFLLSLAISRRISRPMQELTHDLRQADNPGYRLKTNYVEREIEQVARAFNQYLSTQQKFIDRERNMIALVSHELRTPIAVIQGAAEVIEKRDRMQPDDKRTLRRILNAAMEMSENVNGLLKLVRGNPEEDTGKTASVGAIVNALKRDYLLLTPSVSARLKLNIEEDITDLAADPTLLRLMLHNFISNALTHTNGQVQVNTLSNQIEICDEGGTTEISHRSYADLEPEGGRNPGLGLYICTLVCERYGWTYDVARSETGFCVNIHLRHDHPS